jgi:ferredoxin-like protein FixX
MVRHGVAMGMAPSSALLRVEDKLMSRRYTKQRSTKPKGIDESADAATLYAAPLCDIATHPCHRCGRAINDRYPQFTECTTCAVAVNTEAMIPWRTTQREIARQRIAETKMRLHEKEGETYVTHE